MSKAEITNPLYQRVAVVADKTITSDVLVAYSQCPRKAFLLLFSDDQGTAHDYPRILEERRKAHQAQYLEAFKQTHEDAKPYDEKNLKKGSFFVEATLKVECWEADCDVLTKVDQGASSRKVMYEPTIAVGTYSITKEQKTELSFIGKVLGQIQKQLPAVGTIVGMDGKAHRVKLESGYKAIAPFLKSLQAWMQEKPAEPPALILNKHCPSCQFRNLCREQAVKENNLSLLDRMTPKAIQRYNKKKGIFTIQQFSYLFRSRKERKKKNKIPVKHNLELQALAIREKKIYIQELPELTRQPVELFLDIEGIPDRSFYYLIGILICQGENSSYYSYWADSMDNEKKIWKHFTEQVLHYPEAPIYHYGSYEQRAINDLLKRYLSEHNNIQERLINLNSYIYGKIYFPTFSNKLKEIGNSIRATWESIDVSGLDALAWRYFWEEEPASSYHQRLIKYNKSDCEALNLLFQEICKIKTNYSSDSIEFADQHRHKPTGIGSQIYDQLETIIKFSYTHESYDKSKIKIRKSEIDNKDSNVNTRKAKIAYHRIIPKANRLIHITEPKNCIKCNETLQLLDKIAEKTVIDLIFTKNGIRKTIIKYWGNKTYCQSCNCRYNPEGINKRGNKLFGHAFQSWMVYQRLVLRLSYNNIVKLMEEQFNERVSLTTITESIKSFAHRYSDTEDLIIKHILGSSSVHVDETQISIRGVNQYVWVFTSEKYVVFKLTKTREASIVHETLSDYKGVLISDFYSGYDSVNCQQQKCWVHLIRDLNEDLLDSPFDKEFEVFILRLKDLIIPIFEAIEKFGLKKRNLNKFKKQVEKFYEKFIDEKYYSSQLVIKYQKRFIRYRNSLFTFLEQDGISWHNNNAESAIRHFTKQRDISGSFFESFSHSYLTLLGIAQTCKFQNKSLLRFLLSGEENIDNFRQKRKKRNTKIVGLEKGCKSS